MRYRDFASRCLSSFNETFEQILRDTDEKEREIEIKREKERSASSHLLRRHRVYRGTRMHRASLRSDGGAFIRGKSEV